LGRFVLLAVLTNSQLGVSYRLPSGFCKLTPFFGVKRGTRWPCRSPLQLASFVLSGRIKAPRTMRIYYQILVLLALLGLFGCNKPVLPDTKPASSTRQTKPTDDQIRAILAALSAGRSDTVRAQFGDSLDPNFTFADGKTVISAAAAIGNAEIIPYLIEIGGDATKADKRGMTPLHYAAFYGRDAVIPILISAGVSANVRDATGLTPLHCAATGESEATIKVLVKNGADLKLKDGFGATPEKTAELNEKRSLANLLKQLAE